MKTKPDQDWLWNHTISGSQVWRLYSATERKRMLYEKVGLLEPEPPNWFAKKIMDRGKEREPYIIAKIIEKYQPPYTPYYQAKTFIPDLKISGNVDLLWKNTKEKTVYIFEVKSSASINTLERGEYQIIFYSLLWKLRHPSTKKVKLFVVMEDPNDEVLTYYPITKIAKPQQEMLRKIKAFWKDYKELKILINRKLKERS